MKAQSRDSRMIGVGGVMTALLLLTLAAPAANESSPVPASLSLGVAAATAATPEQAPHAGRKIFDSSCAACHHRDSRETLVGPGLQGLFKRTSLPVSGRPVSDENIGRQLRTPFQNMPEFPHLSDGEVKVLVAYLHTI